MKKNRRRKIIITAGVLAAAIALCLVLACGTDPAGDTVHKAGQERVTAEEGTEKETDNARQEKERRTVMLETEAQPETKWPPGASAHISGAPFETESTVTGFYGVPQETEGAVIPDTTVYQDTQAEKEMETETTVHVHSYVLADTKQVQHPAVTEQVWVEDSSAWDEVIREGYHVCVVTCHECGAQFSDPSQGNALEAWGNHIDLVHDGDGGYDMAASYDVPAEVIHHDASGHYETRIVTAAWTEYIDTYRCSCGAAYTQTR